MQRQFCLLKLVYFFTGLAGKFHNFELTQNREKTRNGIHLLEQKSFFDKESENEVVIRIKILRVRL
jgi:hypothetical protein